MNYLTPLASLLGLEIESVTERVRNTLILNAIMAVLGVAALGFLVAAGFMALADQVGGIYAALIIAAIFLVLTLVVYIAARIGESRRRRELAAKRRSTETSAFVTTAALTALPVLLQSPLVRAVGIPAAVVGAFMLARKGDKSDK